jgi:hypothetical protein
MSRESPAETSHGGIAPAPLASLSTRLPLELGAQSSAGPS